MRGQEYGQQDQFEDSPGDDQYQDGSQEGESATKKLVGSRVARKRAEEDVKLLANRI